MDFLASDDSEMRNVGGCKAIGVASAVDNALTSGMTPAELNTLLAELLHLESEQGLRGLRRHCERTAQFDKAFKSSEYSCAEYSLFWTLFNSNVVDMSIKHLGMRPKLTAILEYGVSWYSPLILAGRGPKFARMGNGVWRVVSDDKDGVSFVQMAASVHSVRAWQMDKSWRRIFEHLECAEDVISTREDVVDMSALHMHDSCVREQGYYYLDGAPADIQLSYAMAYGQNPKVSCVLEGHLPLVDSTMLEYRGAGVWQIVSDSISDRVPWCEVAASYHLGLLEVSTNCRQKLGFAVDWGDHMLAGGTGFLSYDLRASKASVTLQRWGQLVTHGGWQSFVSSLELPGGNRTNSPMLTIPIWSRVKDDPGSVRSCQSGVVSWDVVDQLGDGTVLCSMDVVVAKRAVVVFPPTWTYEINGVHFSDSRSSWVCVAGLFKCRAYMAASDAQYGLFFDDVQSRTWATWKDLCFEPPDSKGAFVSGIAQTAMDLHRGTLLGYDNIPDVSTLKLSREHRSRYYRTEFGLRRGRSELRLGACRSVELEVSAGPVEVELLDSGGKFNLKAGFKCIVSGLSSSGVVRFSSNEESKLRLTYMAKEFEHSGTWVKW